MSRIGVLTRALLELGPYASPEGRPESSALRGSPIGRYAARSPKGTLYLYFRNKEELFEAVVRQSLVPYIEGLEAGVGGATEPAPVLLKRLMAGCPKVISSPVSAIPKLVITEAGNFPELARFYLNEVVHRSMAVIRQVIRTGIDRGEFRGVDIDATVMCVLAPVIFAMLWRHSLGLYEPVGRDPQTLCDTHLQLLLNGLVDRPPAADETEAAALDQEEATR